MTQSCNPHNLCHRPSVVLPLSGAWPSQLFVAPGADLAVSGYIIEKQGSVKFARESEVQPSVMTGQRKSRDLNMKSIFKTRTRKGHMIVKANQINLQRSWQCPSSLLEGHGWHHESYSPPQQVWCSAWKPGQTKPWNTLALILARWRPLWPRFQGQFWLPPSER